MELPPNRAKDKGSALRSFTAEQEQICSQHADLRRFDTYQFQPDFIKAARETWTAQGTGLGGTAANPVKVCFLGDSHQRVLASTAQQHIEQAGMQHTSAMAVLVKYPAEISRRPGRLTQLARENRCTDIVFSVGQWSAGWPDGSPHTAAEYQQVSFHSRFAHFEPTFCRLLLSFLLLFCSHSAGDERCH